MGLARPHNVAAEIYVNSAWIDIAPDLRDGSALQISRGRPNESSRTPPSQCQFTLDNSSGNYSLRNPNGAYYGALGRNTPLRVALRTEVDSFTRTLSTGWGSTDTGGAWTGVGAGGSVAANDFSVSSGVAKHSVPATSAYRLSYLDASLYSDVDVAVTVSGLPANVTGGAIEPANLVLSGVSVADYWQLRVTIDASEVIRLAIYNAPGTIVAAAPVVVPVTYTGQALRVRFQLEGQTLRGKLWDASGPEPYAWHVTDDVPMKPTISGVQFNRAKGCVGIRSGVATGNTNALPIVFSYDNFEVRNYRFTGEVTSWPSQWDLSEANTTVQITASGITRRLNQGKSPTPSAFYRGITSLAVPPLVYWPMEDGAQATEMASGIQGGITLPWRAGPPKLAANSDFLASAPIPVLNGAEFGDWYSVNNAPDTGVLQTTFLVSVPDNGDTDTFSFIQLQNAGSATYWNVEYGTLDGGSYRIEVFDRGGGLLLQTAYSAVHLDGRPVWMSLELVRNGANIDWALAVMDARNLTATAGSGTLNGVTLGALQSVKVNPDRGLLSSAVGHVMSRNYYTSLFNLASNLGAYAGETSRGRIDRLSAENGVPFTYIYDGIGQSALIGTQARQSYMDLINEAASTDVGALYEGRSSATIVYRVRNAFYSQVPRLALDYGAGQVSSPFEPVEDDQALRNSIDLTRKDGSRVHVEQTTGPLSVSSPFEARGVGLYDTALTQNLYRDSQLPDAAAWQLALGTVDEPRYPSIGVDLLVLSRQMALDAMAVDVGDRITIANPRPGFDPNMAISQIAQGYKETITSFTHGIVYTCTPEAPYATVRLDTVDQIDSGSSKLASGYSSTATALSVTTTNPGDLWKTGAASIPIMVAGERMTVTNIANATSPQTFTVTRSTNSVVKAQLAAAEVHVARPARLAY